MYWMKIKNTIIELIINKIALMSLFLNELSINNLLFKDLNYSFVCMNYY